MRHALRLSAQEQYLRGETAHEKWEHASALGFDGLELRAAGEGRFAARLPELKAAAIAGVPMPTVCVEMLHFVGDFDPDKRADALVQMKSQLSVMAEIGGRLAMTPASYGMFSRRLPPFTSPRTEEEDTEILLDAFGQLAAHAEAEGVIIALEPLNRYENHMINTLADAASLCAQIGSPNLGIAADTYYMNIEEADPLKALVAAAPWIRHVQVSDSNRLEPGAGHIDWSATLETLWAIGYTDELAYECRLSGDVDDVLGVTPPHAATGMVIATATSASGIDHDRLGRAAVRVLIENWHGHATVPSRSLYPHQWSWDSAFIALGLQHFAPRRAAAELLSLFGAQWDDGRIPHIAFNPAVADDAYFPGPSFWRSVDQEGHPPIDTSGIIQPPVHAIAAAAVVHGLGPEGRAFADRVYRTWWRRTPISEDGEPSESSPRSCIRGRPGSTTRRPGMRRCTPCLRTCRCFRLTPVATSITREPVSGRPTRTIRATSGWPWRIATPATTTTGCGNMASSSSSGLQRTVGVVGTGPGRDRPKSLAATRAGTWRRRRGSPPRSLISSGAKAAVSSWLETKGPTACCPSGRWPD